jgi:hypothetical protein
MSYGLFVSDVRSGAVSSFQCSPCISPRSDMYRQRAAEAKNRATQASNPHVKTAFEEVARAWLLLAEQMEWMDPQEEMREGEASADLLGEPPAR